MLKCAKHQPTCQILAPYKYLVSIMKSLKHQASQLLLLASLVACVQTIQAAPISFQDVSASVGLGGQTESWGLSWGDINADNWPDLFVQGHRDYPRLYRNSGSGVFDDVAYEYDPDGLWIGKPWQDKHGAAFGDFDNDGDEDILIAATTDDAQLLVNEHSTGGKFIERAQQAGLADDARARHVTWFDYTGDGYLDVTQLSHTGQFLRRQEPTQGLVFTDELNTPFNCPNRIHYGQLIDLNNDDIMDFICSAEGAFPQKVYEIGSLPFTNITSNFPTVGSVLDQVVGDFNNDLLQDVILVRGLLRPSGASQTTSNRAEGWFRKTGSAAKGFRFNATGSVAFTVDFSGMPFFGDPATLTLDSAGQTSGSVGPVNVSLNTGSGLWEVDWPAGATGQIYVQVEAAAGLSNVTTYGKETSELPIANYHAVNTGSGLSFNFNTGLNTPMPCVSGVAADFDNDMDQDLYLVCRDGIDNLANRYFDNQGNGTFVEVLSHGGEGPVGAGLTIGVGDSVATADYNVDGFMDLAVVNGLLYYPLSRGGDDILLRNEGNANNWIEIDLIGTTSNRDGIGAKVIATTGGVSQLREQNNGTHRWSQNHQRIHFGLATNTTVDITVKWPSGQVDTFTNVAANQLYDLTEGTATDPATVVPAVLGPVLTTELVAGEECGEPPYNELYGPVVLAWRDCPTGTWHLRMHGGGVSDSIRNTVGNIVGDAPFNLVTGTALTGSDSLTNAPANEVDFSVGVWFNNVKDINIDTTGQSSACLSFSTQDIPALIVGNSRKKLTAPLDLVSLGVCNQGPTLNISDVSTSESVGAAQFSVSLSTPASQPVQVTYATSPGTATAPQDYLSDTNTLTFPVGTTSVPVSITLVDDNSYEPLETFEVILAAPVGASLGTAATGTATITDDDPQPVISINNASVSESSASSSVTVNLSNPSNQPVTLDYTTVSGTAVAPEDFIEQSGVLTFAPNTQAMVIDIPIQNDTVDESDESFSLVLSNASNATLGANSSANIVIVRDPNDSIPAVTISDSEALEDVASGTMEFTVSLTAPNSNTISVDYNTSDVTATAPDDYVATGGNLSFAPNQTTQTISVDIVDNTFEEPDETFSLTLSNPIGATLSAHSAAIGTITDNDTLSIGDACGEPTFDAATEIGLFLWRDCTFGGSDQRWQMRITGGGTVFSSFEGQLESSADLLPTPISVEANDVLDTVAGDNQIDFVLRAGGSGQDGFTVDIPSGTSTCFNASVLPPGAVVALGANRTVMTDAFALDTLQSCTTIPPGTACGEPSFNAATDLGVFAWQDCGAAGPDTAWEFRITGGGTTYSTYQGSLTSSVNISATGVLLEASDELDTVLGDEVVDYVLRAGGQGIDGFSVTLPQGSDTCFDPAILPSGASVTIGANNTPMSNPFKLDTLDSCAPPTGIECGAPTLDNATDAGIYVWKECSAPNRWQVRAPGGSGPWAQHSGNITATQTLVPSPVSLEPTDLLDLLPGDGFVNFSLFVGGTGIDGFEVDIPNGAEACLDITTIPAGTAAYFGPNKTAITTPFNLEDLGACP